jgi:peptidoglycan/LPS O-acetylase OafA/YrhL
LSQITSARLLTANPLSDTVQYFPTCTTLELPGKKSSVEQAREPVAGIARLPMIDVARGGAALIVCALHARLTIWIGLHACIAQRNHQSAFQTVLGILSAPLAFGATAVPLFFVVSGYCIHRSFAAKLAAEPDHEPNWRAYFIRRAWRIYPVLIAVMVITFLLDKLTVHQFPNDPMLGSLSLKTMLLNLCALQGLAGPYYGSNGPLWTLSVEMQLYAVYPVIFYLIKKRGMNASLLMTLGVSMVSAAAGFSAQFRSFIWFGPYWFCWTLGCMVADLEGSKNWVTLERCKLIGWLLTSTLGFVLWLGPFRTLAFSFIGCFWALIILNCLQTRLVNASFLPLALMARLGAISYSLYAIHVPVCLFARSLFFHGTFTRNILFVLPVMGVCILVATALFFFVERYSLRLPAWFRTS